MPTRRTRAYLLSPLAERDLEDVWIYTFRTWSREQADRYHGAIVEAIEPLASGRKAGRDASDVRGGYRRHKVGRHVLFYRQSDEDLSVMRVLHQSMDVPAQLGADG